MNKDWVQDFSQKVKTINWDYILTFLSLMGIIEYLFFYYINKSFGERLLLGIIIVAGIPFILRIIRQLLKRDMGADVLAMIAIITAVILKSYLAAMLLILMLASGESLENYASRKASSVLQALAKRMPSLVHRKRENKIEDIPLKEISLDETVVVFPHEVCPVDGVVMEGHGAMDESYLTGEPYQISKAPGSKVLSGAINGENLLHVKVEKLTHESRYFAIVKVLQEAEEKRPKIRRLADQLGGIFVPIALTLALLAWYFTGNEGRFLAVLVIATPCPLLIAIPITIISAISLGAKQSIIIKDPSILERLPTCRTAIFDKTGTLTYGKPSLTDIMTSKEFTAEQLLQLVGSVERYSKHPLAQAILKACEEKALPLLEVSQVAEKPGEGLQGRVNHFQVHITSRKHVLALQENLSQLLPPQKSGLECLILIDDHYAGALYFRDTPRKETHSFLSHLSPSHQFNRIMLVSGDRASEVEYLGKLFNLTEIYAAKSPEEKLEIVREEVKKAPTLFMGDGINDAPALTAATVGVAFGNESDITSAAAGAVIMESTLSKVDQLFHLCMETRKIALQSAIFGMAFSFIGMSFAAMGYISPVQGAILQEIIDVLAILNALRLTWRSKIEIDLPTASQSF